MVLLYSILTGKTIDVGKIILREMRNCSGVEESEDPKEEEDDDPREVEPEQSAKVPDEAEPMEPEAEPDIETSMFRAQPPSPDLRDELSKLMDIMPHMQWQQKAYWRD
ncbi:hypothetical protein J1N35_000188 [Gossypium stocksii]|uniref:Uncharacterized protein n=1 Tax=Gossypium stocksii TaxID=47602 RepID=A0A9D3WH78_9ROSI|nr:hypothetical protein J1N35_000188 [Gossypium stocksii]